ncbi:16864_t:CDS:2, partial [Entrophospora sp. SA101]
MDDKTLENYVEYLKKLFLRPIIKKSLSGEDDDTNVGDIERYRQWCINHLYTLLKDPRVKRSDGWIQLILDIFIEYGFFTSKNDAHHSRTKKFFPLQGNDAEDEKMERFDEKLSEIFKTKKKELAKKI